MTSALLSAFLISVISFKNASIPTPYSSSKIWQMLVVQSSEGEECFAAIHKAPRAPAHRPRLPQKGKMDSFGNSRPLPWLFALNPRGVPRVDTKEGQIQHIVQDA